MAEVLSFSDVKRQKDFELEKSLLKELSLTQIIQSVKACLTPLFPFLQDENGILSEGCIDFAIEAYLLGGRFGVFGYYGESLQRANARSAEEEEELTADFLNIFAIGRMSNIPPLNKKKSLKRPARFINSWWTEGFLQREKQCKLRMR
ncbi:DUF2521 family protein [Bacillus velezensis]